MQRKQPKQGYFHFPCTLGEVPEALPWPMALFHRAPGACPACDRDVPRLVTPHAEVFICPAHGRLEYGPGRIPLEALGHAAHAPVLDLVYSQPLTGLELVH